MYIAILGEENLLREFKLVVRGASSPKYLQALCIPLPPFLPFFLVRYLAQDRATQLPSNSSRKYTGHTRGPMT